MKYRIAVLALSCWIAAPPALSQDGGWAGPELTWFGGECGLLRATVVSPREPRLHARLQISCQGGRVPWDYWRLQVLHGEGGGAQPLAASAEVPHRPHLSLPFGDLPAKLDDSPRAQAVVYALLYGHRMHVRVADEAAVHELDFDLTGSLRALRRMAEACLAETQMVEARCGGQVDDRGTPCPSGERGSRRPGGENGTAGGTPPAGRCPAVD